MKLIKSALFGALCILTLTACSTQENYDNTAATHPPQATENNSSVRDDAGNIINDAGDMADDAGKAVGDAVKDVGDAVKK